MDVEHGVPQHILEGSTHLQDGLRGGSLVHAKQVSDILKAAGHGQLEQGEVHLGVCGKDRAHAGLLSLQVGPAVLEVVLEGGPGHAEIIQPLTVVPGVPNIMPLPVLTGPGLVGLEA